MLEELCTVVERFTGLRPRLKKRWPDTDPYIWLFLPDTAREIAVSAREEVGCQGPG